MVQLRVLRHAEGGFSSQEDEAKLKGEAANTPTPGPFWNGRTAAPLHRHFLGATWTAAVHVFTFRAMQLNHSEV